MPISSRYCLLPSRHNPAGPWNGKLGPDEERDARSPAFGLRAVEISELQQESGRQVGRSAGRQVGLSPSHAGHRDGRDWDDPGGDACLGPPRP